MLHDGVQICITSADEDVLPESVFDFRLHSLRAVGHRVQVKLIGVVVVEEGFELLLLGGGKIRQELWDHGSRDGFDLVAEFVMEICNSQDDSFTEETLLDAAIVSAR